MVPDSRYPYLDGQPMVAYAYTEPWACARSRLSGQTVGALFGVNNSEFHRMTLQSWKRGSATPLVEGLRIAVLDVDRDKIDDPSTPGRQFTPDLTKSAQTQSEADELGSWIFYPHDQNRINEYAQRRKDSAHIEKYARLREAPFLKNDIPHSVARSYGRHSYAYVKIIAEMTSQGLNGIKAFEAQRYTPEDLEWLEEHMRAQGIPIPEAEE